jgi:hypothetical protein
MIQRIQSVYLGLAIFCISIATAGIKIASFTVEDGEIELSSCGLYFRANSAKDSLTAHPALPLYLLGISFVVFMIITLMHYKNLKRQLALVKLSFYVSIVLTASIILLSFVYGSITYSFGSYLIFITTLLVFLAQRGIKKDKTLIDSVDRIR